MLAFLPRRCWPCLADQAGHALAFSCNNNHNVNSSGHVVHSPSCDEEHEQRTAECRDGRLSFSEHPSEHARITVEWNTGIEVICSPKTGPFGVRVFRVIFPWLGGAEDDESLEVFGRAKGVHSPAGR
jgi:hypothetical protein